ncbi:hypothetical protein P691DRAFT_778068 [Macrolepiota fuliginosa MF-IS2]|uniref:Uncharacterized protein n=1 Tax=Macrolepiota fuliginosa MF-IS2 TaxID=1400762 RepID=A0A9P5X609_9AGAR|nr:hypothetical protein P691DRAFT_778068 [Macrolepiota fuliginosa MF-IS2]
MVTRTVNTLIVSEDASREVPKATEVEGPEVVTSRLTASRKGKCIGFLIDKNGSMVPFGTDSRKIVIPVTTLKLAPGATATSSNSGGMGQTRWPSSGAIQGYLSFALRLYGVDFSFAVSVLAGLKFFCDIDGVEA